MPTQVQKDMTIVSKHWSDQVYWEADANRVPQADRNEVVEETFETVLSKSQKKKMRQKNKAVKQVTHNT